MRKIRQESDQPINTQSMKALHLKYMALAKDAQVREDRVLSESYYQRAEYYLHAINYPSDSIPVSATPNPSIRKPHPNNQVESPSQEGNVLPFRRNFLRRKRGFLPR
jgi:hypothetical protein